MNIENYFEKNEIIKNLGKYELFYQVTLGNLISLTNAKDMNYEIEFQLALGSIYELLKDLIKLLQNTCINDLNMLKYNS